MKTQKRATQLTRARYDRIAGIYDRLGKFSEKHRFQQWRTMLWSSVCGPRVLEIGVGTGKNFPFYRNDWHLTAIDLSPRMLEQAQRRVEREHIVVDLQLADAQALPFADESFETVVATFVFCSVPDPVLGLREAARVLVPGGQLLLLEHVLSHRVFLRALMQFISPLMRIVSGANINRETVHTVEQTGLVIQHVDNLWSDIFKFIKAEKPNKERIDERNTKATVVCDGSRPNLWDDT